jgi:thiol-disulfide isomerase/thioredoxin
VVSRPLLLLCALAAGALCAACSLQESIASAPGAGGPGAGGPASPISGPTTTGAQVSLSMHGGVTVVDFWGSWCGPCRAEQPALNQLYSQYHQRGVSFIGVDMLDDTASANAYRTDFSVPYPSVEDATGAIAAAYDVTAPPTLIVVNRSGTIAGRFLGTLVGTDAVLNQALG